MQGIISENYVNQGTALHFANSSQTKIVCIFQQTKLFANKRMQIKQTISRKKSSFLLVKLLNFCRNQILNLQKTIILLEIIRGKAKVKVFTRNSPV